MLKIESRDNQKIKRARRVGEGREENLIFVEGARLAEEALRSDLRVEEVFVTGNFAASERGERLLKEISARKIGVFEVSEKIFVSIAETKNSQGVILLCAKPRTGKALLEKELRENSDKLPVILLLHQTNNPSNLGAVLRTCEAAGATGVILTENSTDVFSPKALRSSLGASFRLPIWKNANFFEALNWAKENNLISVCADVNAKKSYLEIDWTKPRLLIFGSEAHGLSETETQAVDESLIIPMENGVESLNLAVSCAVILFEAKRSQIQK